MTEAWPALCTALALAVLLILIIRCHVNAFVALVLVSLGLGLGAGLAPGRVAAAVAKGVGDIMANVALLLALGAMLGRILDVSGAAEVIARSLIHWFGPKRASLAVLLASYLIGIPVLFNVGFLLLIPIVWRLQRETGQSLLWFALPLSFSLGITHSLIPPHPGIVGAVNNLAGAQEAGRVMIETIVFGTLMGLPLTLIGWYGPGRWWARRQWVAVPEHLVAASKPAPNAGAAERAGLPSFGVSILVVLSPLVLSVVGFSFDLLARLERLPAWMRTPLYEGEVIPGLPPLVVHSPLAWLTFIGKPEIAMLIATGLAFYLLGMRRGMTAPQLGKLAGDALPEVGGILLLFGAAGAFKEVIDATGAGPYIGEQLREWPVSPVLVCYVVGAMMRVALGSATASILAASALLTGLAAAFHGRETLLVLAVANGVTLMTQPADSGFWMVKEYCNLSVRDVLIRFNACRVIMSLTGLALLLAYEYLVK
jgi:gluconate:H+ symporter, GntP family